MATPLIPIPSIIKGKTMLVIVKLMNGQVEDKTSRSTFSSPPFFESFQFCYHHLCGLLILVTKKCQP
jgi:hypothetical protein